jgi:hypothetical protein
MSTLRGPFHPLPVPVDAYDHVDQQYCMPEDHPFSPPPLGSPKKASSISTIPARMLSARQIHEMAQEVLRENVVVRTDGWVAYRVLKSDRSTHEPVVVGDGSRAVKLF